MSDALLTTLATTMAQLITAIDTTDEDEVDPYVASKWFEHLAYVFGQLPPADRHRLAALFREAADQETDPGARTLMMELPESFGLVEDDA